VVLSQFNPLNAELNPICHLLALLGAHPILHISKIRVKEGRVPPSACRCSAKPREPSYNNRTAGQNFEHEDSGILQKNACFSERLWVDIGK